MLKRASLFLLLLMTLFYGIAANAALNLELTKGIASALPIAVVPFQGEESAPVDVTAVISHDLGNSGEFNVLPLSAIKNFPHTVSDIDVQIWRLQNINDIVIGQITKQAADKYEVSYSLVDIYARAAGENGVILSEKFTVPGNELRRLAHHISDSIYQKLTGDRGVFSTKIAYILVQPATSTHPRLYKLNIADIDGHNAQSILTSTQPIMSPAWSPDGNKIAYVSFETFLPQIYVSDVRTGGRRLLTSFTGINGAPSWSPDGSKLAVALSQGGNNPNIYMIDLGSNHLEKLTNDLSINTEPSFSADGQSLLFTSDRGGGPQLYQFNLNTGSIQRLTYQGNYNATGSYTPDNAGVVFLHRNDETYTYNVAFMNLRTGEMKELTSYGKNQSPSLAPNGKMVVFASEAGGQGVLGVVATNGKVSLRIPDQNGSVQQPAWSPFL